MLPLILIAQIDLPQHNLPDVLKVTPKEQQILNTPSPLQKQELQQLEEKLNLSQKDYELNIEQLRKLPSSRIDCQPQFPPILGVDPISCKRP
ncbi:MULTISPECIES: hypothetical protein [Nostocales]|uniref:Uncharacterized protein n=2 Tax=Nostocales TaxID=1161 RepID=A0A0C1N799_9CYAN|nr:hypothetical protein [Tolypothrix bouteillei]KAF3886456.1 hypothetical protein DA73_0400013950 [Tolypothrix bouteillei VB521301]